MHDFVGTYRWNSGVANDVDSFLLLFCLLFLMFAFCLDWCGLLLFLSPFCLSVSFCLLWISRKYGMVFRIT